MRIIFLGLLIALTVNFSFGQQTEKLDYCNCQDEIDQISPTLNGQFETKCDGVLIEKGGFANGVKHGEWITYSRNAKLIRRLNYDMGVLNGKVELFFLNGDPKVIGEFENGNKIGRWTYYNDKGKLLMEGSYDSNKPIEIWTINDKKGKKPVVRYDFNSRKYILNGSAPFFKDNSMVRNENTEEWYILRMPNLSYSSKSAPLGGYSFANYMFANLVEVPEKYWNTYLYQIYKASFKISTDNAVAFDSQLFDGHMPDGSSQLTFLISTDRASKLNKIEYSNLQIKLVDLKVKEALALMPPWIYNDESDIDLYFHYVLNKNL